MLMIVLTVIITMLVTSAVFVYKMCKCGVYVPFILAENNISYELGLNFNTRDRGVEIMRKAVAFQSKVAGQKVNE